MRVGIIGCGNISETYFNCQNIYNNFNILKYILRLKICIRYIATTYYTNIHFRFLIDFLETY